MVFMEIHGVSHSVTKQSSRMREELEMVFPAETLEGMEKRQAKILRGLADVWTKHDGNIPHIAFNGTIADKYPLVN